MLPTVTETSRTSLLAGRLLSGDKTKEKTEFEGHPRWGRRRARLFHHIEVAGAPGAALSEELTDTLTSDIPLVAAVINTVDDVLDKGRQRGDGGWSLTDVGRLAAVLGYARTAERVVIVTSDHGHVVDQHTEAIADVDAASARHRLPVPTGQLGGGEPREGEIALAGPRVLAPGERIVTLWDPAAHYLGRRGGYHGGASPAEVTVPVLAFLPFRLSASSTSRDLPPGWRPLADQRPRWWSLETTDLLGGLGRADAAPAGPHAAPTAEGTTPPRKRRRQAEEQTGPALFDLPADAATGPASAPPVTDRTDPVDLFVAALLASELFRSQLDGLARKVPVEKVEAAVRALLDANGTLATSVVAERAGERPGRAAGFAVTLQRLFNIDNYPVLEPIDDNHTLRLNVDLLRSQFGLTP